MHDFLDTARRLQRYRFLRSSVTVTEEERGNASLTIDNDGDGDSGHFRRHRAAYRRPRHLGRLQARSDGRKAAG